MAFSYKELKYPEINYKLPYRIAGEDCFFYMFRRYTDGFTKIGITDNVHRRMQAVSKDCGVKLHPILWMKLKNQNDARELEREFLSRKSYYGRSFRKEGEWFKLPLNHLLKMQNAIRARAWDKYEVKAMMRYEPTVIDGRGVDNGIKRAEAIAASLDINQEDALLVWKLLNEVDMFNIWHVDFFDDDQWRKLNYKYLENVKPLAVIQCIQCGMDYPWYSQPESVTSLCLACIEKMLSAYASKVDEEYLRRCTEAIKGVCENTEFLEYIGLLDEVKAA